MVNQFFHDTKVLRLSFFMLSSIFQNYFLFNFILRAINYARFWVNNPMFRLQNGIKIFVFFIAKQLYSCNFTIVGLPRTAGLPLAEGPCLVPYPTASVRPDFSILCFILHSFLILESRHYYQDLKQENNLILLSFTICFMSTLSINYPEFRSYNTHTRQAV